MFSLDIAIEKTFFNKYGQTASGVFHHLDEFNMVLLHHQSINLDYLGRIDFQEIRMTVF
jgi:hypothetical protein